MPWAPLLRLVSVTATVFGSMAVVTPTLHELIRNRFVLGQRESSLFMLSHSLPQLLLLGIAAGLLSDRWGRRVPLAILGCFITGVTTILIPFQSSFGQLLALRFIDGIFGIIGIAMLMTRALDIGSATSRPRIMAIFMTAIPLGYLGGSAFSLAMGAAGASIDLVYGLAGGTLCLVSLLLLFDLATPEQVTVREPGLRPLLGTLRNVPRLWLPLIFGFVDKFSFALLATLPALVLRDLYKIENYAAAGGVMTAFWIAYAVSSTAAGKFTVRLGLWPTIAIGSVGYGLCLSLPVVIGLPSTFVLCIAMAGAFTGLKSVANLLLVGNLVSKNEKATAISTFNMIGSFGILLGFVYTGIASSTLGYAVTFAGVGIVEVACGGFALLLLKSPLRIWNENSFPTCT